MAFGSPGAAFPTSRSAVTPGGPAPTPYSLAAGRRVRRSASVAPRGSGRSRRAGLQRQTRPEARTQAQAPFHSVAWSPEITPRYVWKLWITRVCVNRRRCGFGLQAATSRRDSTRSRQARQLPKRSGRPDLRGGAVELSVHDDSLKAGAGRERLPLDARGILGRGRRCPGFNSLLAGLQDRIKTSSGSRALSGCAGPGTRSAPRFSVRASRRGIRRANQSRRFPGRRRRPQLPPLRAPRGRAPSTRRSGSRG